MVGTFPINNSVSIRDRLLDALYSLKFRLVELKLKGEKRISTNHFYSIMDEESSKDIEVENAICEALDLKPKKQSNLEEESQTNERGISRVKALQAFKNTNEDLKNVA